MSSRTGNIVWLASYPKSGNTWFRIFIANLFSSSIEPILINTIKEATLSSNRALFDKYSGVNSSDLSDEEINIIRPKIYRQISSEVTKQIFLKVHDAWGLNNNMEPIFPPEATNSVIYFIRNPLDIAISFAFHSNISIDKSIHVLNNHDFGLSNNPIKLNRQLNQKLRTWSEHVISWIDKSNLPVLVLRYEDMLDDTLKTFSKAVNFLNLPYTEEDILLALNKSKFENLQIQEQLHGFIEKPIHSDFFFRTGKSNVWKKYGNSISFDKIISNHQKTMRRFNYLK